jgi:hypothetical protein
MNINIKLFLIIILLSTMIIYIIRPVPQIIFKYPNKNVEQNKVCYR